MRRPIKCGTTLVEILVVLALLGIVAGVVTPALPRVTSDPAERAAGSVLELLRATRNRALREGQQYEVIVTPRERRMWVMREAADSGAQATLAGSISDDVRVDAASDRIRFVFPSAGVAADDSLVVRSSERSIVILVDPWTGEPRAFAR